MEVRDEVFSDGALSATLALFNSEEEEIGEEKCYMVAGPNVLE